MTPERSADPPAGSSDRPFSSDLDGLAAHYSDLFARYGDDPRSAQWADRATQERRFEVLAQVGDLRAAKVLDFGCGTGSLLDYLTRTRNFAGEYVGYDLTPSLIAHARDARPTGRFEVRNALTDIIPEEFDYCLISGVFNNWVGDTWGCLTTTLKALYPRVRKGLAFNALSCYVDYFDPGLYYTDPGEVFRFCKEELSPRVMLRHDYEVKPGVVPFEFAVYVYPSPEAPRRRLRWPG